MPYYFSSLFKCSFGILFGLFHSIRLVVLPGKAHFCNSVLIAAIKGMAGSDGARLLSANTLSISIWGAATSCGLWKGPALNGRTEGDVTPLSQAPCRGGSIPGEGAILRESEVFGLGRAIPWVSVNNLNIIYIRRYGSLI